MRQKNGQKVFLSSTGQDLSDYRNAGIEVCNRLGLVPIVMEFFESMGSGATEGSLSKLDESDVYVGIFAHRYGYVEDGYDKSVTELEFERAAERGIDQLCFLVDPTYPWPPDLIDYENMQALRDLKNRIGRSLIRMEFTTVDDFKMKLMQSIVEWLQRKQSPKHLKSPPYLENWITALPPRPPLVIGREDAMYDMKRRLGIASGNKRMQLTIVRGWPGVGKTTLVSALVNSEEVKKHFCDGVLWAALGQENNAVAHLADWGRQLGDLYVGNTLSLTEIITKLSRVLRKKQMLLVVDDVWNQDAAVPFKRVAGPECALIITTRFQDIARQLSTVPKDDVYVLDILVNDKALELLKRVAPQTVKLYPHEALKLVQNLEGLPLAIRVAGRLLESEINLGIDIRPFMQELCYSHRLLLEKAPDDRFDPVNGTTPTVDLLFKASTDSLDSRNRERFALLGVFAPKPATFDIKAMKSIWLVDDPIPTVRILVDRGLLELRLVDGRYWLHALLAMHASYLLDGD